VGYGGELHLCVIWLTAGVAEREIGEQKTGHAAMFNDILRGPENNRWHSMSFKVPGDQTHGLMADGSQRDEKRNVGIVLTTTLKDFRSIRFHRSAMTVFGWCAIKVCANGTDPAVSYQLL